tara:strand:- start:31 stop:555 length:525 start_codon:yes stop_codon:yes gene_type:complete
VKDIAALTMKTLFSESKTIEMGHDESIRETVKYYLEDAETKLEVLTPIVCKKGTDKDPLCSRIPSLKRLITRGVKRAKKEALAAHKKARREEAAKRRQEAAEKRAAQRESRRQAAQKRGSYSGCRMLYLGNLCGMFSGTKECTTKRYARRWLNVNGGLCERSSNWGRQCDCTSF